MNLDIDALRSFVAVADERSFTRAAVAVSRTQSAVSMQIRNLEERLGATLFERTKRSVALTTDGEKLLDFAREILKLNDEGVRELTGPRAEGRLRLGITEYFAPEHMPSLLARFARHHPSLSVEVTTGVTGPLREMQKAGELDLVIGRRDLGADEAIVSAQGAASLGSRSWVPVGGTRGGATGTVASGVRRARSGAGRTRQGTSPLACGLLRPERAGRTGSRRLGLAVGCLTHSALREDFRVLGAREGLPPRPDSEIVLYVPRSKAQRPVQDITELVLDYFSQAVPTVG